MSHLELNNLYCNYLTENCLLILTIIMFSMKFNSKIMLSKFYLSTQKIQKYININHSFELSIL